MKSFDQTFKTYHNLSDSEYKEVINKQADLGYEMVNHSTERNRMTITYKRNKDLKYYYRLVDLEKKINKSTDLISKIQGEKSKILNHKSGGLASQKKASYFLLAFLVITDIFMIWYLTLPNVEFMDVLPTLLILIGIHAMHILWFRYLSRRGRVTIHDEALYRIETFRKSLALKAKNISKELK